MERHHFEDELQKLKNRLLEMGALVEDRVHRAVHSLIDRKAEEAEVIIRGDRVAASIVDRVLEALGAALGAAMNVLDPELIIVTGGVANSLVGLEAEVRRHTARFTLPPAFASARILIVPSGKHETVRGGAALARYEHAGRTRTVVTI